jgi:hypothetical protein
MSIKHHETFSKKQRKINQLISKVRKQQQLGAKQPQIGSASKKTRTSQFSSNASKNDRKLGEDRIS